MDYHVFIKYGPGNVVTVLGPHGEHIDLYPGSEAHLKLTVYEKEKEKK